MPPKPQPAKTPAALPAAKPWQAPVRPKPRFVPTGDTQLDALLLMKEAIDETGALDQEWDRRTGYKKGYCR
jgi:hypothetical protein